MEGNQLGESLVRRKRTLSKDSDDETEKASPKRAGIDHRGPIEPPSPNDAKTHHRGPTESPISHDARTDHQDRPSSSEAESDHQSPIEPPTLGEAKNDHQGPRESSPTDDCQRAAVDKPNPDEARIGLQGPSVLPTPDEVRGDHQGPRGSSPTGDWARIELRRTEERHFYSLYKEIVDFIKNEKRVPDEEITKGIDTVFDAFRFDEGHYFGDIDFNYYRNVCAYLFRLGPHGAGLARCRVLEAARHCEELKKVLCEGEPDRLKVVSLGGGPGNDALGFCSALAELGFYDRGRAVDVTVVDKIPQWRECVDRTNTVLGKKGGFGDLSEMIRENRVTMDYVTAAIQEFPPGRFKSYRGAADGAVANADILLLQRVLTAVKLGDVRAIMKYIDWKMKATAFVIIIDTCVKKKEGRLVYGTEEYEDFSSFDLLYLSDSDSYSLLEHHERFEKSDDIESAAQIAVLRRK